MNHSQVVALSAIVVTGRLWYELYMEYMSEGAMGNKGNSVIAIILVLSWSLLGTSEAFKSYVVVFPTRKKFVQTWPNDRLSSYYSIRPQLWHLFSCQARHIIHMYLDPFGKNPRFNIPCPTHGDDMSCKCSAVHHFVYGERQAIAWISFWPILLGQGT